MRRTALLMLILLLSGCAAGGSVPAEEAELYREKALAASVRVYENVTPDQALQAAETVLTLADPQDMSITRKKHGIAGTREFFRYLVVTAAAGTDYWTVNAVPAENGTRVQAIATGKEAYVLGPQTGAEPVADNSILQEDMVLSQALYTLFFERLDYLLGRSATWPDCKAAAKTTAERGLLGDIDMLCGRGTADKLPSDQ
ncbi:hypothetical protein [Oleidesulfovibrio alaskensis]